MTLNSVASYFGDPVMRTEQIELLVDEAAEQLDKEQPKSGAFHLAQFGQFAAKHQLTQDFLAGKGSSRYGNKV